MNPKKIVFVIGFLAVFGFLFNLSIPVAKAITVEELQAQIQALLAQITALQQQITETQGTTTVWCHDFNTNLRINDKSSEITQLKQALIKDGSMSYMALSLEEEFDEETASAVVGFQEKYKNEILTPYKLNHGTGFVGKSTRAKLNALYGCGIITPSCSAEGKFCGGISGTLCCSGLTCQYTGDYPDASGICIKQTTTAPSITVLSPNGGETLKSGTYHSVKWSTTGFSSNATALIQLQNESMLAGGRSLVETKNVGSYNWLVTPYEADLKNYNSFRIEVSVEENNIIKFDESDAPFIITAATTAPSITVLSPNGGEKYTIGTGNLYIKYNVSNISIGTEVTAYLKSSTGSTERTSFGTIKNDGVNDLSMNMELASSEEPGQYKIEVCATVKGIDVCDTSNSYFNIVATTTSCHTVPLWSWDYCSFSCKCNTGEGDCDSDYECNTGYCALDAGAKYGQFATIDVCEEKAGTKSITLLSPNGGETLQEGSEYKISWNASNLPSDAKIYITLFRTGGANMPIVSNLPVTQREYVWKITGSGDWGLGYEYKPSLFAKILGIKEVEAAGYSYQIMVSASWGTYGTNYYGNIYDSSDGWFYINPSIQSSITVLSPNGGEQWVVGNTYAVKWTSDNLPAEAQNKVSISLIPEGSSNGTSIFSGVTNDGNENWIIPSTVSPGKYRIDVGCYISEAGCTHDASDNYFSIVAATTCSWPNGCCSTNADCPAAAPYCVKSAATEGPKIGTGVCDPGYAGHYCDKSEGSADCQVGFTCNTNCNDYTELSWCSPMYSNGQVSWPGYATGSKIRCLSCYEENNICKVKSTPSVTVISPNGGETYKTGDTVNIKWSSINISAGTVKIALLYMHNDPTYAAGQYFEDWIIETTANAGYYAWKIPEYYAKGVDTSSFTIKISATDTSDFSNGKFNIIPGITKTDITVTKPLTGAAYYKGDVMPVTWASNGTDQYSVNLLRNNDPSFLRLLLNTTGSSPNLSWKIPSDISDATDYFIRVNEGLYRSKTGYSGTFSVKSTATTPSITVISPNGGEQWEIGKTYNITWAMSGVSGTSPIDIFATNGESSTFESSSKCTNLSSGESVSTSGYGYKAIFCGTVSFFGGTYKYSLTVPSSWGQGSKYKINIAVPGASDSSDNYFSIVAEATALPDLQVIDLAWSPSSPKSGQTISFVATVKNNSSVDVTSPFTVNLGGIASIISSLKAGATATVAATFGLTIPGPNQVAVRVDIWNNVSESNEQNNDFSKAVTIYPAFTGEGTFTLKQWETLQLNNGLILQVSEGNSVGKIKFKIYDSSYQLLVATDDLQSDSYWVSTGKITQNVTIKVYSHTYTSSGQAYWTANFNAVSTIPSSITVLSPNGGERWAIGNTYEITWKSSGTDKVHIDITSGSSAYTLVSGIPASAGKYSWTIGASWPYLLTGDNYKIRVFTYPLPPSGGWIEGGNYDQSNNYFSIVSATAACTDSDGGINYYTKGWAKDSYDAQPFYDYCTLNGAEVFSCADVSQNCGIIEKYCDSNNRRSGNYISGSSFNTQCPYGCNDGACRSGITVTSPNAGGTFQKGSMMKIEWIYLPLPSDKFAVNLLYGDQDVAAAHLKYCDTNYIQSSVAEKYFSWDWKVGYDVDGKEIPDGSYRIFVYNCGLVGDKSDVSFSITTPPSITLLYPNGGEMWVTGYTYDITWKSFGVNKVMIELSVPGRGWYLTYDTQASLGKFSWKVEGIDPGISYKINIWDPAQASTQDTSDNYFSIIAATTTPSVTLLYPNGGEQWEIGKTYEIKWVASDLSSLGINIANDSINLTTGIADNLSPGAGSYSWTIPSSIAVGDKYKILAGGQKITDMSDNYFSIVSGGLGLKNLENLLADISKAVSKLLEEIK